jgi:hypothetical protein
MEPTLSATPAAVTVCGYRFVAMAPKARHVFRALLLTAGRPVLLRALALWSGVGIVATILFAGNGINARDVTRLFHGSPGARLLLTVGWCLLATPVVSGAFDAPGTRTLRTLPVPRGAWVAALAALLLLAQAPCGLLFARAEGAIAALVAMLLAVATEASAVAATRRPPAVVFALGALALVVVDARAALTVVPAAALAVTGVASAWNVALEAAGRDVRTTRVSSPVLVLAIVHLLRMVRVARARVALAVGSVALGTVALVLSLVNDPPARPVARALAVLALPVTLCAAVLVGPACETEDRVRALARVTRTRWTTLLAAFALALTTPSSVLAATAGAIAGVIAHVPALPLGGGAGIWAVPIACAIAGWARWHDRRTRRSPTLFVVGVVVVAAVATGVGVAW